MSDSIPHILNFAESCVFVKQSLLPALCPCIYNYYTARLLIPKLRSYFAEFLQHYYPNHLSILYQSTCVQFRVRPTITIPQIKKQACFQNINYMCLHTYLTLAQQIHIRCLLLVEEFIIIDYSNGVNLRAD